MKLTFINISNAIQAKAFFCLTAEAEMTDIDRLAYIKIGESSENICENDEEVAYSITGTTKTAVIKKTFLLPLPSRGGKVTITIGTHLGAKWVGHAIPENSPQIFLEVN